MTAQSVNFPLLSVLQQYGVALFPHWFFCLTEVGVGVGFSGFFGLSFLGLLASASASAAGAAKATVATTARKEMYLVIYMLIEGRDDVCCGKS